jgi:hypothetical protein
MSVVPLRNVVLTAVSTDVEDVMAAIYADMFANSTWVLTNEYGTTGPPGPDGGYSFTAQNPSGSLELNIKNNGTQGAPSLTDVRLGINPDGSADPIADSRTPSASAANFSGTDEGALRTATIGNVEFILIEWDVALMVLFKDATRTFTPGGWYWGQCLLQPIAALASGSGNVRLDGNIIFGPVPGGESTAWASNVTAGSSLQRRRIAVGQSVKTANAGITGSWSEASSAFNRLYCPRDATPDSYYRYGPGLERVTFAFDFQIGNGLTHAADQGWISRHLRSVPELLPPFSFWEVGGVNHYMVINNTAANSRCAIPILSPFNPNP